MTSVGGSTSIQRYIDKRSIPEPNTGCTLWTTTRCTQDGYGQMRLDNKSQRVHRVVWELTNGPIPAGLCVLHHCDVPSCVNPAHLFLGSHTDNMRDMVRKGRHSPPPKYNGSKLSYELARVIRERHSEGRTSASLGREYGVCRTTIDWIIQGKTWTNSGGTRG